MFKNFLDDFYDTLFNPSKGLGRVAEERTIWHGLIVYLVVSIIVSLATLNTNAPAAPPSYPPEAYHYFSAELLERVRQLIPLLTLLLQIVFGPLYFFLMVAILNFVAELLDGRGKMVSLGAVLGYAYLPYLVVAVGGLLSRYTSFNILSLITTVAFFWSMALKITGIKAVHDFSWGRASLVYFMPFIVFLVLFILFILLSIVFLLPMAMQIVETLPEMHLPF